MTNNGPTRHRFVCVLNKKIETGRAMNALGHMTAGYMNLVKENQDFRFQDYIDANSSVHPHISDNPFIVLSAKNGNKIRTLREELISRNIPFTDFTDTMIEGTYLDQHKRTGETEEANLEYFGICFFLDDITARELTKPFSLYI